MFVFFCKIGLDINFYKDHVKIIRLTFSDVNNYLKYELLLASKSHLGYKNNENAFKVSLKSFLLLLHKSLDSESK